MIAIVDVSRHLWPLSAFARRRNVEVYGKVLGAVLETARRYADAVAEEVAIATGRSPPRGRALMALGHGLGWGGLALSVIGLASVQEADLKQLLFGPFGIGLLMQLPSGALVRAGRRELRPTEEEQSAVDKRRPVVLLRAGDSDDDVDFLNDTLRPALLRFGPLADSTRMKPQFGEVDVRAELARQMEQAVMLVLAPSESASAAQDIGWEVETITRLRIGHKLLVLMPTRKDTQDHPAWWTELRARLTAIPGFESLPQTPPLGLIAIHLAGPGELVMVTGSKRAKPDEYEHAVDAAIYGMKCYAKW